MTHHRIASRVLLLLAAAGLLGLADASPSPSEAQPQRPPDTDQPRRPGGRAMAEFGRLFDVYLQGEQVRQDVPALTAVRLDGSEPFAGGSLVFLRFAKVGNPETRFLVNPSQIVAVREHQPGPAPGRRNRGFGGGGGGGFGGFPAEPDAVFHALTGGKDVWMRADIPDEVGQRRFDRMAQQLGVTDGKITLQQYRDFMRTRGQPGGRFPGPAPQPPSAFTESTPFPRRASRPELTDRPGRAVVVEIWVAEATAKGEGGKLVLDQRDEAEFSGPSDAVGARLEALQKKGQLTSLRRLVLTAVEGVPVQVEDTRSIPYVTGLMGIASARGGAGPARSISYRVVGTQATLQVRVAADKKVLARLTLSDQRAQPAAEGVVLGNDAGGAPIPATEFVQARLDTELSIPLGQAVLAKGVQATSKSGQARTLVIVAARLREPDTGASK